jgi:hypothetical protein
MSFRLVFRWRAALTLWLVAALLWAPIWGQWHGIAHQVQQAVTAPAAAVAPTAGDQDEGHTQGHTQGSSLCQVLDHLGHASGLAQSSPQAHLLVLPSVAPVLALAVDAGLQACWTPQARAPPR